MFLTLLAVTFGVSFATAALVAYVVVRIGERRAAPQNQD